jgi:hypothetical protein
MKPSAPPLTPLILAGIGLVIPCSAEPEATPEQPAAEASKPAPDAKPFLGVGTSSVPGFLAKHLKLPADTGILVRELAPDGPAAKAGITVDDVITAIDAKAVGSHGEMVDHILTKKPGDEVSLKFIHEGTPGEAKVKLGERPAPREAAAANEEQEANGGIHLPEIGGNMAPEIQKRLKEALENAAKARGGMMQLRIVPGEGGLQIQPNGGDNAPGGVEFNMASSVSLMDEEGSVELKQADGGSNVRVRDKAGKEVWSGPWDNEQDKAAAPPAIRERIEKLNFNVLGGVRLKARDADKAKEPNAGNANEPNADKPAKPEE